MAAAIKQRTKRNEITTKASEIQTLLHQQIIEVGGDVFKRNTERQQELFDTYLSKHEERLLGRLDEQKNHALNELRQQHAQDIERIKMEYAELQNIALKQEAKRVEEIMNDKAMELVKKTQLEGQRKLDDALVEARKRFDREKEEAIKETVRKLQKEFDGRLKEEQQDNKKDVEKLNEEWNEKITQNNEECTKKLLDELEKQRNQLDKLHEENTTRKLNELEEEHKRTIEECQSQIRETEIKNEQLSNEITQLNDDLSGMKHSMKIVMESFREFVESCPGFEEGQADFLLDNIIPDQIENFLTT